MTTALCAQSRVVLIMQGLPLGRKLSQFFLFFLFGPSYFNYDYRKGNFALVSDKPRLWVILIMARNNFSFSGNFALVSDKPLTDF
jgi:hypothetical protein